MCDAAYMLFKHDPQCALSAVFSLLYCIDIGMTMRYNIRYIIDLDFCMIDPINYMMDFKLPKTEDTEGETMILHNVGFDHRHDADFYIDRPEGSGDWLLLLLKTDAVFTLKGRDVPVPKDTFFLYPNGVPQYYRCAPRQTFANDWVHFEFEGDEEAAFQACGVPCEKPVPLHNMEFLSFLVKCLAYENCANNRHKQENILHYMFLLFNKVSEQLSQPPEHISGNSYEVLMTMRNKIYSAPYDPRSIAWASHEVRMSPSTFQRLYKKQFGVTFMQDLINSRVEYAKMLLVSTNLSVQEISRQCGYRNYEHFAKQFKEAVGMSAMQFREQHIQKCQSAGQCV